VRFFNLLYVNSLAPMYQLPTLRFQESSATLRYAMSCVIFHSRHQYQRPSPQLPGTVLIFTILLSTILQTRHNNRTKLDHIPIRALALHQKVCRKTQFSSTSLHIGTSKGPIDNFRIIRHHRNVVASSHEFPIIPWLTRNVVGEDLHHILLRVGRHRWRTPLAVRRDVQGLVVVEEFEDVAGRWGVNDRRADELVHGLVVGGMRGIVHEAGAAGVDCAGDEGEADGALVGDALEGAD
jgi:hypothetical protein